MSREILVNFKDVSIHLQNSILLEHLSLSVHRGELLAIIGPNGCGKSTILNVLMAQYRDEAGELANAGFRVTGSVTLASHIETFYLRQSLMADAERGARSSDAEHGTLASEVRLRSEFGLAEDAALGSMMSDGESQKQALIGALLTEADLILLDEPTNYLDLTGITALEHHLEKLKRQGRGTILVTHDRTLVDNLATRTVLISRYGIFHSTGGSSAAGSLRDRDYESRRRRAGDMRKKIRQLQADMTAKAGWAAAKEKQKIGGGAAKGHISRLSMKLAKRAKVAQHRAEKEIERLEEIKPFVVKRLNLNFPDYEIRNRDVFSLKKVSFGFPNGRNSYLLKDITLSGTTRDKTCLMGGNGSGKSTLLKLILREFKPRRGSCYLNEAVNTAYVPQGLADVFTKERLLDNFADCNHDETTIRLHLGAALLRGDKVRERVTNFSYGELMRAAIVKCLLRRAEFLFLDEPTSHLDIESIEVLEQMLGKFDGGILVISHDRAFVENVAERLFMLEDGRLRLV